MDLVLLASEPILSLRRVISRTDRRPLGLAQLVAGTTPTVRLYLIDSAGAYTADSGSAAWAPRCTLGIPGPDAPLFVVEPADFTPILEGSTRIGWSFTLPLDEGLVASFLSGYTSRQTYLSLTLTPIVEGVEQATGIDALYRAPLTLLPSIGESGNWATYADVQDAKDAAVAAATSAEDDAAATAEDRVQTGLDRAAATAAKEAAEAAAQSIPVGLASTTPAALGGAAAVGVATTAARADHVHALPTQLAAIEALTTTTFGRSLLTLAAVNSGVLVTSSGGVASISRTLPGILGIGGVPDEQAGLTVVNNSVALDESASVTSTRLITLTGNLTGSQHRVFDGGFHLNLAGYNGTQIQGTYGGILVEGSGGTLTDAHPLVATLLTEDAVTVTNGQLIRAAASIGAGTTVTNLTGLRVINSATDGTLTNFYGVDIDNFTAATLTAAFRSRVNSGTGKWGLYLDGTAANYVAGNLLVGTLTNASGYKLNVVGTAGFSSDVVITGDLTLGGKFGNFSLRIAASPAGGTISTNVSGTISTNEGASARSDFTLPTATSGKAYTFVVQDSDGLRITAASGDTIRIGGSVSAAAGYVENAVVGSYVALVAINATEWVAVSHHGTWTVV